MALKILGLRGDQQDLPFLQALCQHSDIQIASAAAEALFCLCCKTLPPMLAPLMQTELPDLCHYFILRKLGGWLDITTAKPNPWPNHTLLLAHLAPYFEWLLEQGSLSRKIQTTMLLCRSGQLQFLPQMALLLEIDTQIPFMDWDELFDVKHMSPVRTSAADIPEEELERFYAQSRSRRAFNAFFHIVDRTQPLRDAMVRWLNELDAKAAQPYLKPWLASLGWKAFFDWYRNARNLPELYHQADLAPVLAHSNPIFRMAGADILDRLERLQQLPQSITETKWLEYLPDEGMAQEMEDRWLLQEILESRFEAGLLTPTLGKALQTYNHPWLNTLGRAVCQSEQETFSAQEPPPKIHSLLENEKNRIENEKNRKIAQSRTAQQWLDALCQLDDKELAYQAATSLCLLDARFCLPNILDFLKLAYTHISPDANEEIQHRPQLSVFAELGDAAWIPALLDFISEQKALSYSDTHNLVNHIIGPWLKPEHGLLLWDTFRSTKASDKQAVFLEMLCKIADRNWMPQLIPLLEESDSDLVDQVSEWLTPLVKPEDFALLKPYLSPEHPAFKKTFWLLEQMASEEVKIHVRSILDTYLFRDQLFFSALLWQ